MVRNDADRNRKTLGTIGKHFVTGPFQSHAKRLPDDVYGLALDRFVISTLDIVVLDPQGRIFLGMRTWEPVKGEWWIVGGARNPGESFEQTAARSLKRELGIAVEEARFQFLTFQSYAFAKRRQAPEDHGSHTDTHVFWIRLRAQEVACLKPNEEYSEVQWIFPAEVIRRYRQFHPAIVQICKDYFAAKPFHK